jgi:hypothetical protein
LLLPHPEQSSAAKRHAGKLNQRRTNQPPEIDGRFAKDAGDPCSIPTKLACDECSEIAQEKL